MIKDDLAIGRAIPSSAKTTKSDRRCGAILTLVERKSKFTLIIPLAAKKAQEVEEKIAVVLPKIGLPVWTITFDNGHEFTNHLNIAEQLKCQVFFAFPYHSWERGLNRSGEP